MNQLVADLGGQFHPDYGVVLRAVLFAVDRHQAREITTITAGTIRRAAAPRGRRASSCI
jgi:hypothetical protein